MLVSVPGSRLKFIAVEKFSRRVKLWSYGHSDDAESGGYYFGLTIDLWCGVFNFFLIMLRSFLVGEGAGICEQTLALVQENKEGMSLVS